MPPRANSFIRMKASHLILLLTVLWMAVGQAAPPRLHDERLEINLFAEDPDIVTPIGMAIDREDRVFVLESHTHHPPKGYRGPKADRIKVFTDRDGDGKADPPTIFAEGIDQGMNLAFSPDGTLFVDCAREVLALPDRDGNGVCDGVEKVFTLETTQRYAHNSLLGITFDHAGWLYVSRGNVGSDAWAVRGKDGSEIAGYGDGGNIIRCRPDGTQVSELATGFWNPFNLKFAMDGQLLLVDNDPDARGPNRLLHVVEHGDYGYKSLYGGGGNHPFQGWDGSLPGTLPYLAGTGEAPCDLIDCQRTSFPKSYNASVLATIWNENSIERFELEAKGATLGLKRKSIFLSGDKDFRPVALEADSQGHLYISDWVLVDYPNHGRGRLWRVRPKPTVERSTPAAYHVHAALTPEPHEHPLEALEGESAFTKHTAIRQLASNDRAVARQSPKAALRLAALLSDRLAGDTEQLAMYLADSSPEVKRAALIWAGETLDRNFRSLLDRSLSGEIDAPMFEAYLAAVENLSGSFAEDWRQRKAKAANKLKRQLDPNVLVRLAEDPDQSVTVRAIALSRLELSQIPKPAHAWITPLASSADDALSVAAIRLLATLNEASTIRFLTDLANDTTMSSTARCESLLALSKLPADPKPLLAVLNDTDPDVVIEAVRVLRAHVAEAPVREVLSQKLAHAEGELAEQLRFALDPATVERPTTVDAWKRALASGGHPARGRRVFHTTQNMCASCHTVDGSVALLGPSLAGIAQSVSREQIIHSILRPSDHFPPQYQAWIVHTKDGAAHMGLQLDHKAGGAINLLGLDSKVRHFAAKEIENYEASPHSLMPQGLENVMPVCDFRNLVAFLSSLK